MKRNEPSNSFEAAFEKLCFFGGKFCRGSSREGRVLGRGPHWLLGGR